MEYCVSKEIITCIVKSEFSITIQPTARPISKRELRGCPPAKASLYDASGISLTWIPFTRLVVRMAIIELLRAELAPKALATEFTASKVGPLVELLQKMAMRVLLMVLLLMLMVMMLVLVVVVLVVVLLNWALLVEEVMVRVLEDI